jgi:hypothetical protein
MKKFIYFLLFILNFSFAYSQEDDLIKIIVAICKEYSFRIKDCYDEETLINDLSYNIEYSGNNIENGIKKFVKEHPLYFRSPGSSSPESINRGLSEIHKETFDIINKYLSEIEEANFLIFYLALGWWILDREQSLLKMFAEIDEEDYDANLMFKFNLLKTDIKFRANILSLNYKNYSRQLMSLFDRRTYYKN